MESWGSTLEPMLFNIYVNGLGFLSFKLKYQYADDTALVLSHSNYTDAAAIFKDDTDSLMNWFQGTDVTGDPDWIGSANVGLDWLADGN